MSVRYRDQVGASTRPAVGMVYGILLAPGVCAVLAVCELDAIGFGLGGIPVILYLGCFCLAMSWLVWGLREIDWRRVFQGFVWLAMLPASCSLVCEIRPAQVRDSKARAAVIASALADYRARNGAYPEALEGLVPDYLERVPPSAMGVVFDWRYYYRLTESGDYVLRFYERGMHCWWRGPDGEWGRYH